MTLIYGIKMSQERFQTTSFPTEIRHETREKILQALISRLCYVSRTSCAIFTNPAGPTRRASPGRSSREETLATDFTSESASGERKLVR